MMKPCNKCLENSWTFESIDGMIVNATCKLCGYEVSFMTKRARIAAGLPIRKNGKWVFVSKKPKTYSKGTHSATYTPLRHGPAEGATGDDLIPPWVPYEERATA